MKFVTATLAIFAALMCPCTAQADSAADQLLSAANTFVDFPSSVTDMQMHVYRDGTLETEYVMKVQRLDAQHMRIEFTSPATEKGRKLLRVGEKLFMFLPDLGKSIVISARQSFLGTSFSNGDLLRTDLVADYTPALLREETLSGVETQVLELKARGPDVTYDRILMWIDKGSKRPLREEFYTLSGKRIKSIEYSKPVQFGALLVSSEITVESDLNKHERTQLDITSLKTGETLPISYFQKDSFAR